MESASCRIARFAARVHGRQSAVRSFPDILEDVCCAFPPKVILTLFWGSPEIIFLLCFSKGPSVPSAAFPDISFRGAWEELCLWMFLGFHSEVTGMSSVCGWLRFCCELFWRVLCLDVLWSCFGCDFGFISTRTEDLVCQMDGPKSYARFEVRSLWTVVSRIL